MFPCRRPLALAIVLAAALLPWRAHAEGCLDCHEKKAIGRGDRSLHPPFAENDCTACHADHGEAERLVLARSGNALCKECHETGDAGFLRAHHNIRGDRASCLSCHDPHRSTQERLLRPDRHRPLAFGRCDQCHRYDGRLVKPTVAELCLECHGGEEFARRIAHRPVRAGECLACHDPHASREPFLLKARYAPGRWIAGERDVALCFGCHDRKAFSAENPEGTLFRGAGRNYHALHIAANRAPGQAAAPGQGISCRNCHEVHSSEWPRLVRRELDCGGVPCLQLAFHRSSTGGQCLSGCHGPQAYSFAGNVVQVAALPPPPAGPVGASLPQPSPLEQSINKRCISCHEKTVKGFARKHIHAPIRAGYCSACHLDHGPENRLILLAREDRVCAKCHELRGNLSTGAHKGYPLEESRCSECHDPHAADNPALLLPRPHAPFDEGDCGACHGKPASGWRIPGGANRACATCHDEIGREAHPHQALAKPGCTGCHNPHVAREAKLLRAPRPALCFRCHQRKAFTNETVHPPVAEGDCATCHPPHGSAGPGLLARSYPFDQYVTFAGDRYRLCWECHDEGALSEPARGGDTGFSDGDRNLHALHLRDHSTETELGRRVRPGITCRNCHDPHATESPRLVRRVLDCGGVPCLRIEFHKVGKGGKCLGGCHVMKSYLPK